MSLHDFIIPCMFTSLTYTSPALISGLCMVSQFLDQQARRTQQHSAFAATLTSIHSSMFCSCAHGAEEQDPLDPTSPLKLCSPLKMGCSGDVVEKKESEKKQRTKKKKKLVAKKDRKRRPLTHLQPCFHLHMCFREAKYHTSMSMCIITCN